MRDVRHYVTQLEEIGKANADFFPRFECTLNTIPSAYYQKKLARGKTKPQALILISRRLINIIYGMLKKGRVPDAGSAGKSQLRNRLL